MSLLPSNSTCWPGDVSGDVDRSNHLRGICLQMVEVDVGETQTGLPREVCVCVCEKTVVNVEKFNQKSPKIKVIHELV